ncbi:S-formylglutathione hydrolase [Jannaschia sp. LMIT008]|uniref:S-formylglutathione hydrolase n=1 Tax=Jannaschia maritima TaxID=3032585 RepID=UPI002811928E|nr:S-formylglutathione hydrolase [Jannaschia sp. LMIT008]
MNVTETHACHGGRQLVLTHASDALSCDMTLGLFLPPDTGWPVPILWYLSGLTCTHENATVKAGLQLWAAEAGIAICFPDTSPRGDGVPDDDAFDTGQGAGFYVDATAEPWARHFRMQSYVLDELPGALAAAQPIDLDRQAITGHSMGGHGALTLACKAPGRFRSVSAFAPIGNPSVSDWGQPQLTAYGLDPAAHDATALLRGGAALPPCLIDTGTEDPFRDKLGTAALAAAIAERNLPATIRLQPGHDHSYFTISTFAGDHVAFHAEHLG